MAAFTEDRLLNNSDAFKIHTCDLCGLIATTRIEPTTDGDPECRKPWCFGCKNNHQFTERIVPYAWKLCTQELFCMNVCVRYLKK